jgi:hypothetical protein
MQLLKATAVVFDISSHENTRQGGRRPIGRSFKVNIFKNHISATTSV